MSTTWQRLWLTTLVLTVARAENDDEYTDRIPIVYSSNYNIGFFYLERLHPFDSTKYAKIYNGLIDTGEFEREDFDEPDPVDDNTLLKVHTRDYLNSLQYPSVVARALELPVVSFLPNFVVQMKAINPMRYATGGTLAAGELAIEHGMAINLGGGYHHASSKRGMGFCLFADISLLIIHIRKKYPGVRKFMIVDLDAHQGNGYEEDKRSGIFIQHSADVFIFDVYNHDIFPGDAQAATAIDHAKGFDSNTGDAQYLQHIRSNFPYAFDRFKPDLVIYNAGTDILDGDPLGGLGISAQGIQDRDKFIIETCLEHRVPVVMLLSGGYDRQEADIVIDSILKLQELYTKCKDGDMVDKSAIQPKPQQLKPRSSPTIPITQSVPSRPGRRPQFIPVPPSTPSYRNPSPQPRSSPTTIRQNSANYYSYTPARGGSTTYQQPQQNTRRTNSYDGSTIRTDSTQYTNNGWQDAFEKAKKQQSTTLVVPKVNQYKSSITKSNIYGGRKRTQDKRYERVKLTRADRRKQKGTRQTKFYPKTRRKKVKKTSHGKEYSTRVVRREQKRKPKKKKPELIVEFEIIENTAGRKGKKQKW